jgi:hypothetical protein
MWKQAMRNFISSILAAASVALVLDAVVLPAGFSLAVTARHATENDLSGQVVDRTGKGDRLQVPLANQPISPQTAPTMPIGCEPAFSSLSTGAQANFAGRCLS